MGRESIELSNGNVVESGTWLDGAAGWTNGYRIIDIAESHGFPMDAEQRSAVEWYRNSGESDSGASNSELDRLELVTGHGGLSEKATDYMEGLLPEGWVLRWDDGLTLLPVWTDCAADGGGCDVSENFTTGETFVDPCSDHKPERKIRVVPKLLTSDRTVYLVMLWDESGETLFGSEDVAYDTLSERERVDIGEFWFPETIRDERVRAAAERLLKRTRCEAHHDDDYTLLPGVGVGEPTYCDGSCQNFGM